MARKTIRIDFPNSSPDNLITLSKDVNNKHESDGDSSVLVGVDMASFKAKSDEAAAKRAEAKRLEAKAQSLNAEAAPLTPAAPAPTGGPLLPRPGPPGSCSPD